MKVIYAICNSTDVEKIARAMSLAAAGDSYVGYRTVVDCHTYITSGGSRYSVYHDARRLVFEGSRRSLAYGCGFACVRNGRDGHEIELLFGVPAVIPLQLVLLETSCTAGRGLDDPYACGKELKVDPIVDDDWWTVIEASLRAGMRPPQSWLAL
jgi:hypothetical protein